MEVLLPLLHPQPDLLEKLSQWYWLSSGQEVTALITGEPHDLLQELFQEMGEVGLHHCLSAAPASMPQLEMC